jgi:hypothetical protein
MIIEPKHKQLENYDMDMRDRLMKLLAHVWNQGTCECGIPFRQPQLKDEDRKIPGYDPISRGPFYHEQFSKDQNKIRYTCHGCKKEKHYFARWNEPHYLEEIYKLFKQYNPELLPEVFRYVEGEKLTGGTQT